jgi:hypothetical protein
MGFEKSRHLCVARVVYSRCTRPKRREKTTRATPLNERNSDCSTDDARSGMALDSLPFVRWITVRGAANHRPAPNTMFKIELKDALDI